MALTVWTYDWVPEGPRGFVRDLRLPRALQAVVASGLRRRTFDRSGRNFRTILGRGSGNTARIRSTGAVARSARSRYRPSHSWWRASTYASTRAAFAPASGGCTRQSAALRS